MNKSTVLSAPNAVLSTATDVKAKVFVLDTSVCIHSPECLNRFGDNHIVIPGVVLEELDHIKCEQDSERGRNARHILRTLDRLFPDARSIEEGVRLPGGGTVSMYSAPSFEDVLKANPKAAAVLIDRTKNDNKILLTALAINAAYPPPTIIVSKDTNVRLKARALGLEAADYLNDKAPVVPDEDGGYEKIEVSSYEMQRFASEGELTLDDGRKKTLVVNDYVLLATSEGKTMPARHHGSGVVRGLKIPDFVKAAGGIPIRSRNLEQQFFMDALLDDHISIVTCLGKAGTGKTLLSVACALHQVREDVARYDGVSISRPVISLGKDIGFLPGTMEEKMSPWLKPYHDACEVIMPSRPPKEPQFDGKREGRGKRKNRAEDFAQSHAPQGPHGAAPMKPYERLIRSGVLEIEVLAYVRGRSIPRRLFILDEAQQLTPHEIKTIVSRMSVGSKIILIGDPAQIDNQYVDARSNGLVYCRTRFDGQPFAAHVKLTKGERSPLAEAAANLL